jgi:hypothetical protein
MTAATVLVICALFVISLPVAIFVDSKNRLGRPSWGWTLGSGPLLILCLGVVLKELQLPIAQLICGSGGSMEFGHVAGALFGLWVGSFFFYRAATGKNAQSS